jgi:hypothetical protein
MTMMLYWDAWMGSYCDYLKTLTICSAGVRDFFYSAAWLPIDQTSREEEYDKSVNPLCKESKPPVTEYDMVCNRPVATVKEEAQISSPHHLTPRGNAQDNLGNWSTNSRSFQYSFIVS